MPGGAVQVPRRALLVLQRGAVRDGAAQVPDTTVHLVAVDEIEQHWDRLDAADAIVFGTPTYMAGPSAQFKAFMDSTSQRWLAARGDSDVTFAMLRRYVATQLLDVTSGDYRTVASITGNSEETLRRWYDAGPNLEKKKAVVMMSRL